jgi:hypothetical protein
MRDTAQNTKLLALVGAVLLSGCAKPEYLGNTTKGFWSEEAAAYGPNDAFSKASPYLEATWVARCENIHHHDEWCDKPPIDHMMRRGKFYYLTRTSYPYKNHEPYLEYAVTVNSETGEVIPYK